MPPQTTYAIADIAALKAIGASDRVDSYSRLVKNANGQPSWYTFITTNTQEDDGNLVVLPNDNPISGRWLKCNVSQEVAISRWRLQTWSNTNVARLLIYFFSGSEGFYNYQSSISLSDNNLVADKVANTDFIPGDTFNITDLIQANGTGIYFFIYQLNDGSFPGEIRCYLDLPNSLPKGAATSAMDKSADLSGTYNQSNISHKPLLVRDRFADALVIAEQLALA